jgi:hypothetical protein
MEKLPLAGGIPKKEITEKRINCQNILIKDLSDIWVENPDKIERIEIFNCGIRELDGIERFPNLKDGDFSYNYISKIDCISGMTSLYSLNLSDNPIQKIENLEEMKSLRTLQFNHCKIRKIEGLDTLNLGVLSLCFNEIEKIEGLEKLANLAALRLGDNKIKKIEGLDTLERLRDLDLPNNPISKIEGLAFLSNLESVWCDAVPEFENVEFEDFERKGLTALLRLISIIQIDNFFDVPDIAEVLRRAPDGFSMLKGEHYEGDFMDRPGPDQELVPFDYEDWFFQQAGPRLTEFLPAVRTKHKCQSAMTENSPTWRYILKRSKEFHKN